ncbi:DNA polymerase III, alpha subunit [gamma proteobacterium HTCC5015]|nr:DNA polymerase III, alpha subunit [gamma proteobacterium HTCC5015]
MSSSFVHLRLHTEYSLVDSVVRIKPLISTAAEQGMPALALTDQCNLFAMVKFFGAASAAGIKALFGADLLVRNEDPKKPSTVLLLLAMDDVGYRNLTELVSQAYTEGQAGGLPVIERTWLEGRTEGLIALSGGPWGDIGRAIAFNHHEQIPPLLAFYKQHFPNRFYLELQRTGREGEALYNETAVSLAAEHQLPVVATNDVRFIHADDFDSHEVRVCIHEGRLLDDPRRSRHYSPEQYLRSPEEMVELFSDLPEAIENTLEIAKRCNVAPHMGEYFLPDYPVPDGETIDSFFRKQSQEGLEWRMEKLQRDTGTTWDEAKVQSYRDRLEREIGVILNMGFPGYFLIVADFIQWAKNNGVPVGPGRGSGAGSLVAYALKITDLDPIEYDLLFERFLNPERVSMPDFDVDFCMEGRDRVIDYVAQKYGRDQVSQIITYGSMAAKAVVRDVGRVLGHGYGFVDGIAKLIPMEVGITLSQALEESEELKQRYEEDEEVTNLLDMALKLEGLSRNAGKHAGGVVIAPSKLTDFTPLYCEEGGGGLVTQFDKDDVEAIGLVKFDFLGLRTLTIINWALKEINSRLEAAGHPLLDIDAIPLDDAPTFDLLKAQQTTAVFQLESSGMKNLIKKLQPDSFEDIVALVALFRPGPLDSGMVDDFIRRKHGQDEVSYPHPDYQYDGLKPVLEPTYGIILYQEQVMQIAQVMGGYSLGGADLLRRAMGKKKLEEMAKQKEVFLKGCGDNGIDLSLAENIFDLVEKFAGYGFNKSHSAAYALVSYQTAWLKAHYPSAFMAAVLSADSDNTDKVVNLIEECRNMGLTILPPDVNSSAYKFTMQDDKTIRYGLGALKGVGQGVIEAINEEREANGDYADLLDFCRRIDGRKLNRRVTEALIRGGALDSIGPNRASLMAALGDALMAASQHQKNQATGQVDIFGALDHSNEMASVDVPLIKEWHEDDKLRAERDVLGLYLTGHPFNRFARELSAITHKNLHSHVEAVEAQESASRGDDFRARAISATVAGLVVDVQSKRFGNGNELLIVTLDDRTDRVDLTLRGEVLQEYADKVVKDAVLIADGRLSKDRFNGGAQMRVDRLMSIDEVRSHRVKRLDLFVNGQARHPDFVTKLAVALDSYKGGQCPVVVHYRYGDMAWVPVEFDAQWSIAPRETLIEDLRDLLGNEAVRIRY